MEIGCLDDEDICLGEEQLLFEIRWGVGAPHIPMDTHRWSPDGSRVAVSATGVGGKGDIYWTSMETIHWANITNSEANERTPNWTPDGLGIVYGVNSLELYGGEHRTFRISLTGDDPVQLLARDMLGDEQDLALSPDGNKIAFIHSDENGYYQLFYANIDGSDRVRLTNSPANHFRPAFSPDGQWLIYILVTDPYSTVVDNVQIPRNPRSHLVAINLVTKEERLLFSGGNENNYIGDPGWSPDGEWIAFSGSPDLGDVADIYLIGADGNNLRQITFGPGRKGDPSWRLYYSP